MSESHQQQQRQQLLAKQQQLLANKEFVKSVSEFFRRDLITIPLIRFHKHHQIGQRCNGLKAATLELDLTAYPNIEYIAGNRLAIYPANPIEHVQFLMKHLSNDLTTTNHLNDSDNGSKTTTTTTTTVQQQQHRPKRIRLSSSSNNNDNNNNQSISSNLLIADSLNQFIVSATNQQKLNSTDSFQLALTYLFDITSVPSKDLLRLLADCCLNKEQKGKLIFISRSDDNWLKWSLGGSTMKTLKSTLEEFNLINQAHLLSAKRILSQLNQQLPRQYSISSIKSSNRLRLEIIVIQHKFSIKPQPTTRASIPIGSNLSATDLTTKKQRQQQSNYFDGLCSNYLLNMDLNGLVLCQFIEEPRFTLKGNRERPIIMIGQDVGMIAYRPFWQQRAKEYDRAQVFYTMFKDLKVKKFGDMQLICLTGSKCKIEDLFKHELESILTHKIISSCQYLDKKHLQKLLLAMDNNKNHLKSVKSLTSIQNAFNNNNNNNNNIKLDKELTELGLKIAKLLLDSNGCLYTCCDLQMTQAIEVLIIESLLSYQPGLSRDKIMSELLPKWKSKPSSGDLSSQSGKSKSSINNHPDKFLFTLENAFERAQIVQEIYDTTL